MPERDKNVDPNAGPAASPRRGDDAKVPQDPDVGQSETDQQQSTTSRPRGRTEEADRTL